MQEYQELKLNEGTLRGYLHKPSGDKKVPLVVMYHGFTGHKGENNFLFVQFSRYLCEHGVASLRFDFLGSGESDHDFSYMTFSNEVKEANAILDYAKSLPFVSELIVLGLSMGGAVATQVAKKRVDEINKLILWAPAGMMKEAITSQEDRPTLENGNYDLGGLELSQAFVFDMASQDLWKDVVNYHKQVSIHHAENDSVVPFMIGKKYNEIYPNSELHGYSDGNHTFNNVKIRQELFENNLKFILS